MISAFLNSVKIPELRRRILFTLAVIVIVRLGAAITTPGVNQAVLQEWLTPGVDRKSTRLNSSHQIISYAVFCLKKKKLILLTSGNGEFEQRSPQLQTLLGGS